MPLIAHPGLYRVAQLTVCLLYLAVLCWACANIGYWTNVTGAVILGISTSILTTMTLLYHILTLYRHHTHTTTRTSLIAPSLSPNPVVTLGKIAAEILLLAMWAGTGALMLRPKGKDFRFLFDEPPYVAWGMAVALVGVEL
ncbi:hypothetical protein MMC16_005904 [Acarospora aff. strigata]|nr:hypothetical protein [Acarospora aff. strigata]